MTTWLDVHRLALALFYRRDGAESRDWYDEAARRCEEARALIAEHGTPAAALNALGRLA